MLNFALTRGLARFRQGIDMRQNTIAKRCTGAGTLAFAMALAVPALAQGGYGGGEPMPMPPPPAGADMPPQMPMMPMMPGPGMHGGWQGGPPPMPQVDPRAREAWLGECRHRMSYRDRDNGLGGLLIGGVAGGVIGNRVAGRHHRTEGTIAGAVVGMAIDRGEDGRGDYDYCEAYFDDYYAHYAPGGYGYGAYGYGYAYAVPMMMVRVPHHQVRDRDCVEEVVSEEYVPVRRRVIPRAPRLVPDKRIRIAPDKRVPAS
jgi:hypothetical protein